MNSHSYSFKQSGLSKRALKAPTAKNAERERSRVRSLRSAFQTLQSCLPSVPPDTKLSKLDILILATNYIVQLTKTLEGDNEINQMLSRPNSPVMCSVRPVRSDRCLKYYHPIKKWPMRSRLYSLMNTDRLIEPDCNNNAQLEYRYLAFEKTTIDR